jgi:uncharacterized Tic20 family protein
MNAKPSIEERIWSVLAHLSALAMGLGLALPVVGWSESRRKSNYISFQCLQALGYQTLGYTIWILTTLVVVVVSSVTAIAELVNATKLEEEAMRVVSAHTGLSFVLIGIYFVLPIIAAIACALGMDFRYPFMGKRLARYLGYNLIRTDEEQIWLIEEYEDRWVASTGHFAVIIILWGLLAPIFAWVMQGRRSLFLRFQSIQTVMYQAGTMLLYVVAGFFYVVGLAVFFLSIGFEDSITMDSSIILIGGLISLVSLLIAMLIILAVPLLHILGQWAGYRVLKGKDYRYPIVGRLVEKWVGKNKAMESASMLAEEREHTLSDTRVP